MLPGKVSVRAYGGPIPKGECLIVDVADPRATSFRQVLPMLDAAMMQRRHSLEGSASFVHTPITAELFEVCRLEPVPTGGSPGRLALRPGAAMLLETSVSSVANEKDVVLVLLRDAPHAQSSTATSDKMEDARAVAAVQVRIIGGPILASDRIFLTSNELGDCPLATRIMEHLARVLPLGVSPTADEAHYELWELEYTSRGTDGAKSSTKPRRCFAPYDPVNLRRLECPVLLLKARPAGSVAPSTDSTHPSATVVEHQDVIQEFNSALSSSHTVSSTEWDNRITSTDATETTPEKHPSFLESVARAVLGERRASSLFRSAPSAHTPGKDEAPAHTESTQGPQTQRPAAHSGRLSASRLLASPLSDIQLVSSESVFVDAPTFLSSVTFTLRLHVHTLMWAAEHSSSLQVSHPELRTTCSVMCTPHMPFAAILDIAATQLAGNTDADIRDLLCNVQSSLYASYAELMAGENRISTAATPLSAALQSPELYVLAACPLEGSMLGMVSEGSQSRRNSLPLVRSDSERKRVVGFVDQNDTASPGEVSPATHSDDVVPKVRAAKPSPLVTEMIALFAGRGKGSARPMQYSDVVHLHRVMGRLELRGTLHLFAESSRRALDESQVEPELSDAARLAPLRQRVRRILDCISAETPSSMIGDPINSAVVAELWCTASSTRRSVAALVFQLLDTLQRVKLHRFTLVARDEPTGRFGTVWLELVERERLQWRCLHKVQRCCRDAIALHMLAEEETTNRSALKQRSEATLAVTHEQFARWILCEYDEVQAFAATATALLSDEESAWRSHWTDAYFEQLYEAQDAFEHLLRQLQDSDFLRVVAADYYTREADARLAVFEEWSSKWVYYTVYFSQFLQRKALLSQNDVWWSSLGLQREHAAAAAELLRDHVSPFYLQVHIAEQRLLFVAESEQREQHKRDAVAGYQSLVDGCLQWVLDREELRRQLERMDLHKAERVARMAIAQSEAMDAQLRFDIIEDAMVVMWDKCQAQYKVLHKEQAKRQYWVTMNAELREVWRCMLAMHVQQTSEYRRLLRDEQRASQLLEFIFDEVSQRLACAAQEEKERTAVQRQLFQFTFSIQRHVQRSVEFSERLEVEEVEWRRRRDLESLAFGVHPWWFALHDVSKREATWRSIILTEETSLRSPLTLVGRVLGDIYSIQECRAQELAHLRESFEDGLLQVEKAVATKARQLQALRESELKMQVRVLGVLVPKSERHTVTCLAGSTVESLKRSIFHSLPRAWLDQALKRGLSIAATGYELAASTSTGQAQPLHPTSTITKAVTAVMLMDLPRWIAAQQQLLNGVDDSTRVTPPTKDQQPAESPKQLLAGAMPNSKAKRKPRLADEPSPAAPITFLFRVVGPTLPKSKAISIRLPPTAAFGDLPELLTVQFGVNPSQVQFGTNQWSPAVLLHGKVTPSGRPIRESDTVQSLRLFGGLLLVTSRTQRPPQRAVESTLSPGLQETAKCENAISLASLEIAEANAVVLPSPVVDSPQEVALARDDVTAITASGFKDADPLSVLELCHDEIIAPEASALLEGSLELPTMSQSSEPQTHVEQSASTGTEEMPALIQTPALEILAGVCDEDASAWTEIMPSTVSNEDHGEAVDCDQSMRGSPQLFVRSITPQLLERPQTPLFDVDDDDVLHAAIPHVFGTAIVASSCIDEVQKEPSCADTVATTCVHDSATAAREANLEDMEVGSVPADLRAFVGDGALSDGGASDTAAVVSDTCSIDHALLTETKKQELGELSHTPPEVSYGADEDSRDGHLPVCESPMQQTETLDVLAAAAGEAVRAGRDDEAAVSNEETTAPLEQQRTFEPTVSPVPTEQVVSSTVSIVGPPLPTGEVLQLEVHDTTTIAELLATVKSSLSSRCLGSHDEWDRMFLAEVRQPSSGARPTLKEARASSLVSLYASLFAIKLKPPPALSVKEYVLPIESMAVTTLLEAHPDQRSAEHPAELSSLPPPTDANDKPAAPAPRPVPKSRTPSVCNVTLWMDGVSVKMSVATASTVGQVVDSCSSQLAKQLSPERRVPLFQKQFVVKCDTHTAGSSGETTIRLDATLMEVREQAARTDDGLVFRLDAPTEAGREADELFDLSDLPLCFTRILSDDERIHEARLTLQPTIDTSIAGVLRIAAGRLGDRVLRPDDVRSQFKVFALLQSGPLSVARVTLDSWRAASEVVDVTCTLVDVLKLPRGSDAHCCLFLLRKTTPSVPDSTTRASDTKVARVSSLLDRLKSAVFGGAGSQEDSDAKRQLAFDFTASRTEGSGAVATPVAVRVLGDIIPGAVKVVVSLAACEAVESLFSHCRQRLIELGHTEVALQVSCDNFSVHYVLRGAGGAKAKADSSGLPLHATLEQCKMASGSHVVMLRPIVGQQTLHSGASSSPLQLSNRSHPSAMKVRVIGAMVPKTARLFIDAPAPSLTYAYWYPDISAAVRSVVPGHPEVTPDAYELSEVELPAVGSNGKARVRRAVPLDHTLESDPLHSLVVSVKERPVRLSTGHSLYGPSGTAIGDLIDLNVDEVASEEVESPKRSSSLRSPSGETSPMVSPSSVKSVSFRDDTSASKAQLRVRVIGHSIPGQAKLFVTLQGWMSFAGVFDAALIELRKLGVSPPLDTFSSDHCDLLSMHLDATGVLCVVRELLPSEPVSSGLDTKLVMISLRSPQTTSHAETRSDERRRSSVDTSPAARCVPGQAAFPIRVVGHPFIPDAANVVIHVTTSTRFEAMYPLIVDAVRDIAPHARISLTPDAFALIEMETLPTGRLRRKQVLEMQSTPFLSDFGTAMSVILIERRREVARGEDVAEVFTPQRKSRVKSAVDAAAAQDDSRELYAGTVGLTPFSGEDAVPLGERRLLQQNAVVDLPAPQLDVSSPTILLPPKAIKRRVSDPFDVDVDVSATILNTPQVNWDRDSPIDELAPPLAVEQAVPSATPAADVTVLPLVPPKDFADDDADYEPMNIESDEEEDASTLACDEDAVEASPTKDERTLRNPDVLAASVELPNVSCTSSTETSSPRVRRGRSSVEVSTADVELTQVSMQVEIFDDSVRSTASPHTIRRVAQHSPLKSSRQRLSEVQETLHGTNVSAAGLVDEVIISRPETLQADGLFPALRSQLQVPPRSSQQLLDDNDDADIIAFSDLLQRSSSGTKPANSSHNLPPLRPSLKVGDVVLEEQRKALQRQLKELDASPLKTGASKVPIVSSTSTQQRKMSTGHPLLNTSAQPLVGRRESLRTNGDGSETELWLASQRSPQRVPSTKLTPIASHSQPLPHDVVDPNVNESKRRLATLIGMSQRQSKVNLSESMRGPDRAR